MFTATQAHHQFEQPAYQGNIVNRMEQRITQEVPRPEAARLLTASYILTGLRVPSALVDHLFQGAAVMRESSTYQAILNEGRTEGRTEGERTILLRQGRVRFGEPDPTVEATLTVIRDPERLEAPSFVSSSKLLSIFPLWLVPGGLPWIHLHRALAGASRDPAN